MKAWQIHEFCEPDDMQFADVPTPEPGENQVLIRNRAAALNFFDLLNIQGKYQSSPNFPYSPGSECAGTVAAVGPGVTGIAEGDKVLATTDSGAYGEYSIASAKSAFPIPGDLNFSEAAAFPTVYYTTHCAFVPRGNLQPGEWLLVHAGASGVGVSAIQVGKAMGATVIATAGTPEKLDFCRQQGADHALLYTDDSWVDQVKELTQGRGVDVVYDPVGGDVFDLSSKCIAPQGRLLVIGFTSGRIPTIKTNRLLLKQASVVGVWWGRYVSEHPGYLQESYDMLAKLVEEKKIRPFIGREFPLAEAPAAMKFLAERKLMGKAVLVMD